MVAKPLGHRSFVVSAVAERLLDVELPQPGGQVSAPMKHLAEDRATPIGQSKLPIDLGPARPAPTCPALHPAGCRPISSLLVSLWEKDDDPCGCCL